MSVYGSDDGLYGAGPVETPAVGASASSAASGAPDSASQEVSPGAALVESLELIASPVALASEVFPADPSQSKLPYALAVFGACVVAIIWANSIDKGRK